MEAGRILLSTNSGSTTGGAVMEFLLQSREIFEVMLASASRGARGDAKNVLGCYALTNGATWSHRSMSAVDVTLVVRLGVHECAVFMDCTSGSSLRGLRVAPPNSVSCLL